MKRFLDLMFSFALLLLLFPVFLLITCMIALFLGRPVLFVQQRPGYKGKIFNIFKFRTMRDLRDDHGILLPDEKRITRLGRFLRRLSLDELPQIVNVIKGEMSFIGPRPLLVEYLELYTQEQARRHDVLPGLTGWAQVNGRNAISWDEKFKLDVWYVDNHNLWLDVKILFLTFISLFRWRNVGAKGNVTTMPKFTGLVSQELNQEREHE